LAETAFGEITPRFPQGDYQFSIFFGNTSRRHQLPSLL